MNGHVSRPTQVSRRGTPPVWATLPALCLSSLALSFAAPTAFAAFTQEIVTGTIGVVEPTLIDRPGGFITSISGFASGGNPDPGFDPATAFTFTPHSVEDPFVQSATASATSMYPPSTPNPTSESTSNGTARLGRTSFFGSAQQVFEPGVGQSIQSITHGGWVDTVTVTSTNALLNGTQAIWLFQVNVNNTFDVSGFKGFGVVEVEPYINQNRLSVNTPGFDDGQFNHPVATSVQHAQWQLVVPFLGAVDSIGIVDSVTFAAEITLGTPFDLGIFALGWAAAGTNSAFPTIGSSGEFGGTILWGGSSGLTDLGGAGLGTFDVTSLSGTDWVQAVPVPGVAWLMAIAAAGVLYTGRRSIPNRGA